MLTFDQALAFSQQHNDPLYFHAWCLCDWFTRLYNCAIAQYAETKHPKDRPMQTGHAWTLFLELFGGVTDAQFLQFHQSILRFTSRPNDPSPARLLCLAHALLLLEAEPPADPAAGPSTLNPQPSTLQQARQSLQRWCDWLEALIHFQTHQLWHKAPVCFHPDPVKRELAILGLDQRSMPQKDPLGRLHWNANYATLLRHFKDSPHWPALGQAFASDQERPWPYRELDMNLILLWPMLKRYNWTYRDLLATVRALIRRPDAYPCQSDREFATYCTYVLGLCKKGKGSSATKGPPPGQSTALRICKFLQGAD